MRQARSRLALALAIALGVLLSAAPARAAETVVGFDNLASGEEVTGQYKGQGLELGSAAAFGQPSPGPGDCGAPSAQASPIAFSPPNLALLKKCVGEGSSGTYGALLFHPRGSLSVDVRNLTAAVLLPAVKVITYSGGGVEVAQEEKTNLAAGSWAQITVPNPGNAQLSYFAIVATTPNHNEVAIDNLGFEAPTEMTTATTTTSASTPASPRATPPTPSLALGAANPHAGEPITLSGAGSLPGSGHIISYGWNFKGGENAETSTGTNPVAHVILAPGLHTITMTVTNSSGEHAITHLAVSLPTVKAHLPDGGEGECLPKLEISDANLLAECIRKLPGGGYVISGPELQLNGLVLKPKGGGFMKIEERRAFGVIGGGTETVLTGAQVYVELPNTPLGDLVLGERNLEAEPIVLELNSGVPPKYEGILHGLGGPGALAAAGGGSGGGGGGGGPAPGRKSKPSKMTLMSFGVGEDCTGKEQKAGCCPKEGLTDCAKVPGGFPLTGQVIVYLTSKGQALIDVQVRLNLKDVKFEATGALEIEADLESGIQLSSLKFEIGEASLAPIFKVKGASFQYYFPEYFDESKRDSWQAKGTLTFGEEIVELEAELAFKHGAFESAAMKFKVPHGGVPIYPGIFLNEIGASVSVNPLAFGGSLGASIAEILELELEFKFREATSTELGFFGGKGILSLKEHEIASLAADVYSDGYTDAELKVHFQVPFEPEEAFAKIEGKIGFWDEPATGRWEAYGLVKGKVWVIEAEIAGLVNDKYVAGCGAIVFVKGYAFYSFQNGETGFEGFLGKSCEERLEPYKEHPAVKHEGGFVGSESAVFGHSASARVAAGGENETIKLGGDARGENLRITSSSGTPVVTLVGPSGQTFTTSPNYKQVVSSGHEFVAVVGPNPHQVTIFLAHPHRGEWRIVRDAGSGPISKVEGSGVLPPPRIRAHVRRHGKSWTLVYRIGHFAPGTKVQFLERGRDSDHLIATVGKASGTVLFTPQEALSRPRQIIATVLNQRGVPLQTRTVGHYTAPRPHRPGRPRGVRIVRRKSSALVTWAAVAGARRYRVKVRGSDGRLETHILKPASRSVLIPNALGFESFTATVTAVGGKDMLAGSAARAQLAPVKVRRAPARGHKKH